MGILRVALLLCAVIVLSEAGTCPSGWILSNLRCFNFFSSKVTWGNGEKACLSLGGNLASVHSKLEHDFIRSVIKTKSRHERLSWIGGSDASQEGLWLWSDGLPMKYTNWGRGQPDNAFFNQNCMVINYRGGLWDDMGCNYKLPYVCVKDACE